MIRNALYVTFFGLIVGLVGVVVLQYRLPLGPIVLALTVVPVAGLAFIGKASKGMIPDFIFGALDTGLLTFPALWGGTLFGVAGAIAGGVIGDALTDGVAGFFEGSIAKWLREKGIKESREPVATSLGKMAGCLFGGGLVLTGAFLLGIEPKFLSSL